LTWLVAAVVVCGSVFGYEFFHLSILTLDRALVGTAVVIGLMGVWSGHLAIPAVQRFDLAVLMLLGLLMFNLIVSDWSYRGHKPIAQWVFFYVLPFALYGVARLIGHRRPSWQVLRGALIGLGCYLALTGICEVQGWSAWVFPRYIMNSPETEFLGRARGPFLNPVACGIFQTVGLACGMTLWRTAGPRGRWLLAGYFVLMLAGLFATLTRSVWLAALPLVAVFFWREFHWRWRGLGLLLTPLLLVGALLMFGDKLNGFKRDKNVSVEDMAESAQLRPLLAIVAQKMIWDRPVLGYGLGQYPKHATPYHFRSVRNVPLQKVLSYVQHNVFLAYAVELGLVGLALFVFLIGLLAAQSLRLFLDSRLPHEMQQMGFVALAALGTYLVNGLFHDVAIIPMCNLLLYLMAGIATALYGACYPAHAIWPHPRAGAPGRAFAGPTFRRPANPAVTTNATVGTR
jgi:O-antigen ligase